MTEVWLKASFTAHSFHYRMPDTVAISSVNPAIPSPLTVQMAMLATYLREQEVDKAQSLLNLMPLTIRVRPPEGAIIYRSIMRYVRPPKNSDTYDKNTGSGYSISPHFREFALLDGNIEVYVKVEEASITLVAEALENIPYLGAKDSLVTCLGIEEVEEPPSDCAMPIEDIDYSGQTDLLVLQLATFATSSELFPVTKKGELLEDKAITLEKLIPSQRDKNHFGLKTFVVQGKTSSMGNVKLFERRGS